MAVRWRQGHQETPVVSGAQTLLSTDTKEESGSQTPGRAEEHDKDSGLGTRASTQDPNLSWSATLPGTEVFLGTLGFQCQRNRDDLVTPVLYKPVEHVPIGQDDKEAEGDSGAQTGAWI